MSIIIPACMTFEGNDITLFIYNYNQIFIFEEEIENENQTKSDL